MPQTPQLDLLTPERVWQASLLSKCGDLLPWKLRESLAKCGNAETYRTCRECGHWETFTWKCCLKFCPVCNWRIARERAAMLKLWSMVIEQPKHIVLTQRNFEVLTRKKIRKFLQAFGRIRRTRLFRGCKGGCVSVEITNEGKGWHLHAHILADMRWLDAGKLAIAWGGAIGQEFGIVKVKDARGKDYLGEVTKYCVKGSDLAGWPAEEIHQFILAVQGVRMFTTFGTLFKLRRKIKAQMEADKPEARLCDCGGCDWLYETEETAAIHASERAG
jgi:hypothetical protein